MKRRHITQSKQEQDVLKKRKRKKKKHSEDKESPQKLKGIKIEMKDQWKVQKKRMKEFPRKQGEKIRERKQRENIK